MKLSVVPVFLLLPLASCSQIGSEALASLTPAGASGEEAAGSSQRRLVKSGTQKLEVRDLAVAVSETRNIVKSRKGYIESSTVREERDADLHLRVPAPSLEPTLDDLAALGRETLRRVSIDDVTRQYLDLDAELKNLRSLRDRLRALLAEAQTVKEALEVEKELAKVQTRIDSLESRIRSLRTQVSYSRIDLALERKRTPGPLGAAGRGLAWGVRKLFVLD